MDAHGKTIQGILSQSLTRGPDSSVPHFVAFVGAFLRNGDKNLMAMDSESERVVKVSLNIQISVMSLATPRCSTRGCTTIGKA